MYQEDSANETRTKSMKNSLKNKPNLTRMVVNHILMKIETNRLQPGDYVPSERLIGEQLNVSRVTVRRGLDLLVKQKYLLRIPNTGYRLPKTNDITANKTFAPILFLQEYTEEVFSADPDHLEIWKGARMEAIRSNRSLLIYPIKTDELNGLKLNEFKKISGGLIVDHNNDGFIRKLQSCGLPVVQIHNAGESNDIDRISQDDFGGIIAAVKYLIDLGYKKIGYLDSSECLIAKGLDANSSRRLAGYTTSCKRFMIKPIIAKNNLSWPSDKKPALSLIKKGVQVIIVPHRETLLGVTTALTNSTCKTLVWGETSKPESHEIAYIQWSKRQMGQEATRRIIEKSNIHDSPTRTVLIPARIITVNQK